MIWAFLGGVVLGCNVVLIFLVIMARNHKRDLRKILDEMTGTLSRAVKAQESKNRRPDHATS